MKRVFSLVLVLAICLSMFALSAYAEDVKSVLDEYGETGILGQWYGTSEENNGLNVSLRGETIFVTPDAVCYLADSDTLSIIAIPYELQEDGTITVSEMEIPGLEGCSISCQLTTATDEIVSGFGFTSSYQYAEVGCQVIRITLSQTDNSDPMAAKTISSTTTMIKEKDRGDAIAFVLANRSFQLDNGSVIAFAADGAMDLNNGANSGNWAVRDYENVKFYFQWGESVQEYTLKDIMSDSTIYLTRDSDGAEITMTLVEG